MSFGSRPLVRSAVWFPRLAHASITSRKPGNGVRSSHRGPANGPQQGRGPSRSKFSSSSSSPPSSLSSSPSSSSSASGSYRWRTMRSFAVPGVMAMVVGSSLAVATHLRNERREREALTVVQQVQVPSAGEIVKTGWPHDVASEDGTVRIFTAKDLMAEDHPFLEDDHMFSAFIQKGIIEDMEGYYRPSSKVFSAIVALGREVAGFPRIVHGGLTAAIFDETFGGLLFSLKKFRGVSFWGPAYTVQLEVTYKAKIPAGAKVLCRATVESYERRKLWMHAEMRDGPDGKVYATSRALFVSPKPHKFWMDAIKYIGQRMSEKWNGK